MKTTVTVLVIAFSLTLTTLLYRAGFNACRAEGRGRVACGLLAEGYAKQAAVDAVLGR